MIRNPLLEMSRMEAAKETDNKLRWDAEVEGVSFSLYIPKWRIPDPWPSRIWVDIFPRRAAGDDLPNLTRADTERDSTLRHEPIIATVEYFKDHGNAIRYQSTGDPKAWEIGEPYIPLALTGGGSRRLRLIVLWDLASRGMFPNRVEPATRGVPSDRTR